MDTATIENTAKVVVINLEKVIDRPLTDLEKALVEYAVIQVKLERV